MSKTERIAAYIDAQYVTEVGAEQDNVEALFAAELAYHVGDQTLTRDDVVAAVTAVRNSPRTGRRVEASNFEEQGDTVRWHISATIPGMGDDGGDLTQESDLRAVFNAHGKIVEAWSVDTGGE